MGKNVTDVGCIKSDAKAEIKKHAATIHCSNSLSLLQRKVSNALLYHAYKELMLKEEHEISIKQLCRLIGYNGHNHAAIRDALRGLISTIIEWNLINDETGQENWTASSIIASVCLEGPICYYAYSPRMKQLLHSPSMFGKIDLVIQSRFRSSYGLALYENCIRYRGLPYTKWFDMELFKKLMGIPAGMYDVFRDFKRRVLDKAIDEVNTYSDLVIASDFVREGRKVVRVRFSLKERAKKLRLGNQALIKSIDESEPDTLKLSLVQEFGLTKRQANDIVSEYPEDFIREKMKLLVASKSYQAGKVQNPAGYLLSALKHDYQQPKSMQHEVIDFHDVKFEMELGDLKREATEIRQHYNRYREDTIHSAIFALSIEQKQLFMQQFRDYADSTITTILNLQRGRYTRETVFDSPQVKALLRQFALRELDGMTILPLEEFVANLSEEKYALWQKLKSYDPDHPVFHSGELNE